MRQNRTAATLIVFFLLILSVPPTLLSADLAPVAQSEIAHLLMYIDTCGCQFYRNGTWYQDAKGPREHVEMKYRYFIEKGQVHSTEDFIKLAASKSEISGKPYLVKCNNGSEMRTSEWLTDELKRYRKERSTVRSQ